MQTLVSCSCTMPNTNNLKRKFLCHFLFVRLQPICATGNTHVYLPLPAGYTTIHARDMGDRIAWRDRREQKGTLLSAFG